VAEDKEAFLSRWARLKREQAKEDAEPQLPATPAPALPDVEKLTPESDFSGFMHPKVKEELRRLALKKLFNDPHFNVPDPFEPFSGDWIGGEPIPPELLAQLNQARSVLLGEDERKKADEEKARAEPEPEPQHAQPGKSDEPGRQDA
jgi:hypothetical protein